MSRLIDAVSRNLTDIQTFGVAFPLRHVSKLRGAACHAVQLPGVGQVWLRQGTTDAEVFRQIFKARDYDLRRLRRHAYIMERYQALLADGRTPVIIDAGANVGAASLWFAHEFPEARIIAVEPDAANAAACRRNIAAHPGIKLREAAIGSQPGRVVLDNPAGKAWSPRSVRTETEGIEIVTIPSLVERVPAGRLFIAKIDIEGFEADLFAEATDWIDEATVLIIEIHDWMRPGAQTSFSLQRAMGDRRFELVISGENLIYINVADT